jgi:hypothetical protein
VVKELQIPVVVIGTNVRGRNLDLSEFWPFFARMNKLEIPIIVHSDGLSSFQTHPAAGERTGWWERGPFAVDQPICDLVDASAFSGHLLGNSEGLLIGTTEVSIHPLYQFCRRQQTGGFDHRSFPMDPMRFQGVEPGAFAGQRTTHNPDALVFPFDLPVMLAEPLPHGLAVVPRRVIPHQQQRGLVQRRQLGADPGQEGDGHRTHRAIDHEAQPHVLVAHALDSPLLYQQPITSQGFGVGIGARQGLLDEMQGLLSGGPGVQRGLRQATPPRLIFKAQRPLWMACGQVNQAVAGFFFRA